MASVLVFKIIDNTDSNEYILDMNDLPTKK